MTDQCTTCGRPRTEDWFGGPRGSRGRTLDHDETQDHRWCAERRPTVDELKVEVLTLTRQIVELEAGTQYQTYADRIDVLEKALLKYGQHRRWCRLGGCNCGLALAAALPEEHNALLVEVPDTRQHGGMVRAVCKPCGWLDIAFYGRGRVQRRAIAHSEGRDPRDS